MMFNNSWLIIAELWHVFPCWFWINFCFWWLIEYITNSYIIIIFPYSFIFYPNFICFSCTILRRSLNNLESPLNINISVSNWLPFSSPVRCLRPFLITKIHAFDSSLLLTSIKCLCSSWSLQLLGKKSFNFINIVSQPLFLKKRLSF